MNESTGSAASAVGELAKVAQPVTETFCGLLRDLAGPGARELGEWFGDLVRTRRQRLAVLEEMLAEEMQRRGIAAREVAPEFLLSVCEAACRVGEDELSELWARLLANGVADDDARHPLWIDRLRSMSSTDAKVFEWLRRRNGTPLYYESDEDPRPVPLDRLAAAIARLRALGLVDHPDDRLWPQSSRLFGGGVVLSSTTFISEQTFVVTDVGEQLAALVLPAIVEPEESAAASDVSSHEESAAASTQG